MNRSWGDSDVPDSAVVGGSMRDTKPPSHLALGKSAAGTDLAEENSGNLLATSIGNHSRSSALKCQRNVIFKLYRRFQ
jgi:hypothetical protein